MRAYLNTWGLKQLIVNLQFIDAVSKLAHQWDTPRNIAVGQPIREGENSPEPITV